MFGVLFRMHFESLTLATVLAFMFVYFNGPAALAIEFRTVDHFEVTLSPDGKFLRIQGLYASLAPYGDFLHPHWRHKGDCLFVNASTSFFGHGSTDYLEFDLPMNDKIQSVRFGDNHSLLWCREDSKVSTAPLPLSAKMVFENGRVVPYKYAPVKVIVDTGHPNVLFDETNIDSKSKKLVYANFAKKLEPIFGHKVSNIGNLKTLQSTFRLTIAPEGQVKHVEIIGESDNCLFNSCARAAALESMTATCFGGLANDSGHDYNRVILRFEKEPNPTKVGFWPYNPRKWGAH